MAAPETAAAPAGTAADVVRALLGVLGAPALGQALALEKALSAKLRDLDSAPQAAGFDPLARPPARSPKPTSEVARRRQSSPAVPAPIATGGIGSLIGDALAGKTTASHPAAGTLSGIAAALGGLSGPAPGKAKAHRTQPTPGPAPVRQAARAIAPNTTGAVSQAAGLGTRALSALPGTAGAAPLLEQIAALGSALWWQTALSPQPAGDITPAQTSTQGPARRGQGDVGSLIGTPAAHGRPTPPVTDATASTPDRARSALAGIGQLTAELFERAAHVGAEPSTGSQTPAPRAPSVLAPARGERSAPPAAGGSATAVASGGPAAAAMVPAVSTPPASADDLARALRAEGLLRGVNLP